MSKVSPMQTLDLSNLRTYARNKYGKHFKVLKSRKQKDRKREVLCRYKKTEAWVPIRVLRDRTLPETVFMTSDGAKKFAYAKIRKDNIANRKSDVENKLRELGAKATLLAIKDNHVYLKYRQKFRVSLYSFRNEVFSRRDLWARYLAWTRYKNERPLKYTDREWARYIEEMTKGLITGLRYAPVYSKEQHLLKCTRCDLEFSKRLGKGKYTVIRCPECDKRQSKNYSKQAVAWLENLERRLKIKIQKATSPKGEHRISLPDGTTTLVDGFYKNLVFEYHGSIWHGNPLVFYQDEKCAPYGSKTAYQLLKDTLKRERLITKAGYTLIRIWDQDYLSDTRYNQWLIRNLKRIEKALPSRRLNR